MKKLNKVIEIDGIDIIDQKFGFRPTSFDRKPLIGEHPIIKNAINNNFFIFVLLFVERPFKFCILKLIYPY